MPHKAAHHSGFLMHDPGQVVLAVSPGMSELNVSSDAPPYQRLVGEGTVVVRVDVHYRMGDRPAKGSQTLDLRGLFPGRKWERTRSNRCRLRWSPGGGWRSQPGGCCRGLPSRFPGIPSAGDPIRREYGLGTRTSRTGSTFNASENLRSP